MLGGGGDSQILCPGRSCLTGVMTGQKDEHTKYILCFDLVRSLQIIIMKTMKTMKASSSF